MENPENLRLSVIIASENACQIEDCLNALIWQLKGGEIEVIVALCRADESSQPIRLKFPEVKFISFPGRKSLPFLLGVGINESTGDIVALTDTTCAVESNWVLEILKSHKSPHPVIGGVVEMESAKSIVDWAAYFCEYGQFMRPMKEGRVNELPGNNISFKRRLLDKGKEFTLNGFWKSYWCSRLKEEGIQLISMPSIEVRYKKSFSLEVFLIRRFTHGRCFAGMRIAKVSIFKRMYYLGGSAILPFLFLQRVIKVIIRKRRYIKEFILSFPVSVLGIAFWAFGEFWGYLTGPGNSCEQIYIH